MIENKKGLAGVVLIALIIKLAFSNLILRFGYLPSQSNKSTIPLLNKSNFDKLIQALFLVEPPGPLKPNGRDQ
jgi:hypothetical protein